MQLKPGTLLQGGKYEIVKTLGQGGFGITYEAVQTNLGRKVALKEFFMKDNCEREENTSSVIVPTQSNRSLVEKFRGKFIREARMIASMENNHIVRVYDVFEENGTAYYVMENLPGGSLSDKVKSEGPLPEGVAEKYIRQVADALDYIHSMNTVHLDVKPSNILLGPRGDAVLIDFGISKHYDKAGEQTSSTPVGISRGYAPLEQGRDGDVSQFTPATDIYALGATLYYLVAGEVPPEASLIYEDGLDRPSGISDRIWKVIDKAMQPRRKDRPQSISEFLKLLDAKKEKPEAVQEKLVEEPERDVAPPAIEELNNEETVVSGGVSSSHSGSQLPFEYVDLGLSVKWGTCNVGASKPEEYGDLFAWGEIKPKEDYSWLSYRFYEETSFLGAVKLSKYVTKRKNGNVDDKTGLAPDDDVAHVRLGGKWRMPTAAEWDELCTKCKWEWTTLNEVNGYKVTGPNGNSIFLPAAGDRYAMGLINAGSYGYYWSSSLQSDLPDQALIVYFYSGYSRLRSDCRYIGFSVRPVIE